MSEFMGLIKGHYEAKVGADYNHPFLNLFPKMVLLNPRRSYTLFLHTL